MQAVLAAEAVERRVEVVSRIGVVRLVEGEGEALARLRDGRDRTDTSAVRAAVLGEKGDVRKRKRLVFRSSHRFHAPIIRFCMS